EHQKLKATTTDTTTTTTTTLPPPQAPQHSTTEAMIVKRIGELEHNLADLIQVNKTMEERLDKHGARLCTLEQLDIPQQGHESPKMPPGSPSHQPPPLPPPAGPSGTSGAPRAFGSQVTPPPPPPTSTNQDSPSKGSATPSLAKTASTTKHQAWSTPDVTLKPLVSLTPEDLDMDEAMGPNEQAQLSDEEDIGSAHIPTVNLRKGWWKLFEEERPTTPEPAWSIRSSDVPTGDITTFIDWFCKRRGIIELKPQDLEGPAYEIVKVFHPDVIHLQYQMEECHKILTDSVDDPILRHNVSKPLPLRGPPGHLNHLPPKDKKILTTAVNQWTRQLVIRQRVEDFQLGIESYQTQVNLIKPHWTAIGFEYKHDYTIIEYPRAVIFRDKYGVQMMMRFNEIHKLSDGTLQQIVEALDYQVKEFRINRMNPGLNTRFWTRKDVDQCNVFMFAIQRRLRTRRIFRNLESFVGGRVREGDYRLLKLGFNSLVHSLRALSALRRSGLRTDSTAAKPCQGDSLKFYLITGSIHTNQRGTVTVAAAGQKGHQFTTPCPLIKLIIDDSKKTYNTASVTMMYAVMIQDRVSIDTIIPNSSIKLRLDILPQVACDEAVTFISYTFAINQDYTTASSGNISFDPLDNLSKYLFASLAISPFHNVQVYNDANKPPIPPQDPIYSTNYFDSISDITPITTI
nr:hypothetical protein [Tanacetum cinerariifolium]